MEIFWGITEIPPVSHGTIVTLGNFDGVHTGHQAVLKAVAALAGEHQVHSVVLTFDPHPRSLHQPEQPLQLITSLQQRLERMADTGIDATVVEPYTWDFAELTPEEFVKEYFVDRLHARVVVVGKDMRFGKNNSGDLATVQRLGEKHGFDVVTIDEVGESAGIGRFSSSDIRAYLVSGKVAEAKRALGVPHALRGEVVHGDARGRALGFPTANLGEEIHGLIPCDGVYAGWARFDQEDTRYPAAISVGTNPTFHGDMRRVEAHLVDIEFSTLDVYGRTMTVEFSEFIRSQITYTDMDSLVEQMNQDVDRARDMLR